MEGSGRSNTYHCHGEVVREQEISEIHVLGRCDCCFDCYIFRCCCYCAWSFAGLDLVLCVDERPNSFRMQKATLDITYGYLCGVTPSFQL